jgi:putative hemolysin
VGGLWGQLALVLVLIIVNAAFAGSEMALISLREGQLKRLEQQGPRGHLVSKVARDPNQFLSTVQIGITLAGFLASAAAAVSLAEPLVEPLGFLGAAARAASIVLVTTVLTFVTLVLGELAPKRLALQRAEKWALRAARPLTLMATITRPAVWLLSRSTDLVVRLLGGDPNRQRDEVTQEEVRDMITTQDQFRPEQRAILEGAFEIAERRLRDVVVPRSDVIALLADMTAHDGVRALVDATHSRAPVHRGDLDEILGIVTIGDLVDAPGNVGDHVRLALALPESMKVLDALRRLQSERQQLAVVINEYGGTEGIVTLEDILEELVGEIYDEFDPDAQTVRSEPDGSIVLPGRYPIHDLPDIGVTMPSGAYSTIAGLVMERLGRVGAVGDKVEIDEWSIEVLAVTGRAISRVRLRPLGGKPGEDEDEPED